MCVISDECFAVPEGYRPRHSALDLLDEEDELLQLAIRQSLLEQEGSAGKENEVRGSLVRTVLLLNGSRYTHRLYNYIIAFVFSFSEVCIGLYVSVLLYIYSSMVKHAPFYFPF